MPKVLVVDDDPDILVVIEILLEMKGFEVDVTANWENIFHRTKSFNPDLILLDVLISGSDGRELCRELKSGAGTKHIPVILFSAHPATASEMEKYGANDFIAKPFDVNDLLEKINRHLPAKSGH